MPNYPQLVYLSVPELVGAAGGDPWQIDDTIQAGAPGEISELATSFRAAGTCITETDEEFLQAKKRFEESWDRDGPAHPINDAEEVRRATQWLRLSREQMAKVSADLQKIAATLAEAQRSGHVSISGLNGRLVQVDNTIAAEIAQAQADGVNLDWSAVKTAAIDTTAQSLNEMTAVRDAYGSKLDEAELDMAADGYDMDAVAGAEGEGDPSAQQQAKTRLEFQQKLEAGLLGTAPMSPDAATAYLDSSETQGRAIVLNRAEQQLRNMGLSEQGVMTVIKGLGSLSDSIGTGVEQYGTSKETGKHALAGLSRADAELFTKWGSRVGWAGNIAQLVIAGIAGIEYPNND